MRFQVLTNFNYVRTLTDEGGRNKVNALFATEDQVLFVFFGQCWQCDRDARQVNAFVFAQSPLFSTLQITLLPSMAVTSIPIRPSSTSTVLPTDRSLVKPS